MDWDKRMKDLICRCYGAHLWDKGLDWSLNIKHRGNNKVWYTGNVRLYAPSKTTGYCWVIKLEHTVQQVMADSVIYLKLPCSLWMVFNTREGTEKNEKLQYRLHNGLVRWGKCCFLHGIWIFSRLLKLMFGSSNKRKLPSEWYKLFQIYTDSSPIILSHTV